MSPEERAEKYTTETNKLYAGLGRFLVAFEELVGVIRIAISMQVAFVPPPFQLRQQQIAHIFTADLTADPLAKALRSILLLSLEEYKIKEQTAKIKEFIRNLFSRLTKIIQKRNTFIHGTWYIGYANEEQTDFSMAQGIKTTNTADGLRLDHLNHSEEDFLKAVDECKALQQLIHGISAGLVFEQDLLKIFAIKDGLLIRL